MMEVPASACWNFINPLLELPYFLDEVGSRECNVLVRGSSHANKVFGSCNIVKASLDSCVCRGAILNKLAVCSFKYFK